jgi:hypothetical protein
MGTIQGFEWLIEIPKSSHKGKNVKWIRAL